MKASIFDTLRLEISAISVTYGRDIFVHNERQEYGKPGSKDQPESLLLNQGEMVWVPRAMCQFDEKYWLGPELLDVKRLWKKLFTFATAKRRRYNRRSRTDIRQRRNGENSRIGHGT